MAEYQAYSIDIFCFDTKCYNLENFSSDNGDDVSNYKVMGGGGTDGGAIFRFLKDENMTPLKLVIFTDGYVGDFGNPDDHSLEVVWIIKGSDVKPPYGMFAYYEEGK